MAASYQEFTTKVVLNSEEAKNKLKQLQQQTETWIKKRDSLINMKGDKSQITGLQKNIEKNQKAMEKMEKQAHSVIDTINGMDSSSLNQLMQAERSLNAEMKKTPQNTQYFQELTEKLQQVKTAIAGIRDQTKQNYAEQKGLNDEIRNMNSVLGNINTSSLKQLAQAEATLKRQMQEAVPNSDGYNSAAANLKVVQSRIKEINVAQQEIVRTIDKYDAEIKQTSKDTSVVKREMELVGRTIKQLDHSSIRDIEYSIKILNENLREVPKGTEKFKVMTGQLKKLNTELVKINDEQKASQGFMTRSANFMNRNWGVMTQALASITGLTMTIRQCVQSYADMEEAMANTQKYTGLSDKGVRQLNESLKAMDTRTSREQLNELAGAAGRLGITSQQSIMEFVDAADKIGVALGDDLGEGAVDQVGKLAMAFGEDDRMGLRGAMLATGSTINELAQNSAANAGYLVDFTARVAGVGKQMGLTQAQIMGFGAVMDENMLQDEMASTAFTGMMSKMRVETSKFAQMAGMDVKDFTNLINTDFNSAILALAENLKKQDPETMFKMLDAMGLDGARAAGVLANLADKIDDVKQKQELAANAYREGTSVIGEYNKMNSTVQAGLDKAKKSFHEVAVELGEKLEPVAAHAITTGGLVVKGLSNITTFVIENKKALILLAATIGNYSAILATPKFSVPSNKAQMT